MTSMPSVSLRAFGAEPADLELDFESGGRPELTTRVIAQCAARRDGRPFEQPDIWPLRVGQRIALLLEICERRTDRPVSLHLPCPNSDCRKWSEVEVTLREVLAYAARAQTDRAVEIKFEGRTVSLRQPTGEDQLAWLRRGPHDDREAVAVAAASLLSDDGEGWTTESLERLAEAADAALAERDPLVGFTLTGVCPECGSEGEHPIDWTEIAFRRFSEAQRDLIQTVHRLASRYHWSEPEIFAVPAWRRQLYLAAVGEEE